MLPVKTDSNAKAHGGQRYNDNLSTEHCRKAEHAFWRFQHSSVGAVPAINFPRSAKRVGKEQTPAMHCHRAPAF